MLMITVETGVSTVIFHVDGRLAGAGVRELARSWSAAVFDHAEHAIVFDLSGVTSVDDLGKAFLAEVHRYGDTLVGGPSPVHTGCTVDVQ